MALLPATEAAITDRPGRARAGRMARWLAWPIALLVLGSAFAIWGAPIWTDWLAGRMLANSVPPSDFEFPPTPLPILASSTETGALNGQGRGLNCSIPPFVERTFFARDAGSAGPSARYRQACVAHDLCYRHGAATYGYTQADCDQMLVRAAYRMCRRAQGAARVTDKEYQRCIDEARKVYVGVFAGGASSFRPLPAFVEAQHARGSSSYAEYEPFPLAGARYAVPRLVRTGKGTSLVFFKQRAGGARYGRYEWDGASYQLKAEGDILGRWSDQPSPPFVLMRGNEDMLAWWRRSAGSGNSTNGSFALAQPEALNGKLLTPRPASNNMDPGAGQIIPVQGLAPDGRLHFIGITEFPGNWDRCGRGDGIQIVHVTIESRGSDRPLFWCRLHRLPRLQTSAGQIGEHVGSYLAAAPNASFVNGAIRLLLFRRDGIQSPGEYSKLLSGLSLAIPLDDRVPGPLQAVRRCWNLAETEEPYVALQGSSGLLGSLTFVDPNGQSADLDTRHGARAALLIVAPSAAASCTGKRSQWLLPPGAERFLVAEAFHVRVDGPAGFTLPGAQDLLVLSRVGTDGKSASVMTINISHGEVKSCTQTTLVKTARDATPLSQAQTAPIVGDLNQDAVPDLVLADTLAAKNSVRLLGRIVATERLTFVSPGWRSSAAAVPCVAQATRS